MVNDDVEKLINEDIEKTLIKNLRSIGFVIDDDETENTEEAENLVEGSHSYVKFGEKKQDDLWSDCSIIGMIALCIAVFIMFFCWLIYLIGHNTSPTA